MTERCVTCGAEIPEGRQVCHTCEVKAIEHDYGFEYCCGGCGTLITFTRHPADDGLKTIKRFCSYCGRRIEWDAMPVQELRKT